MVLCGTAVPEQFEDCPERRYFAGLHYLALVCSDVVLAERLRNRPSWRGARQIEFFERMVAFNRWLIENASHTRPPMSLLDNTVLTVGECANAVVDWVRARL